MFNRKLVALLAALALLFAACGDDDDADTTAAPSGGDETTAAPSGGDDELIVGVSWNNYNEERWAKSDEPFIKAALDAEGVTYISTDAGSSAEQQLNDVELLISQGADALIILDEAWVTD